MVDGLDDGAEGFIRVDYIACGDNFSYRFDVRSDGVDRDDVIDVDENVEVVLVRLGNDVVHAFLSFLNGVSCVSGMGF